MQNSYLFHGISFILIVIIIYLLVHHFHDSLLLVVEPVKSTVDHQTYWVRSFSDKQQASDLLARMRLQMLRLIKYLTQKLPYDTRVERLRRNFDDDDLSEGSPYGQYTSYSINKGEKIIFCLRQTNGQLVDLNTLMFVALHEMAHIMTLSTGHTPEFWDNMKFLVEEAITLGIYHYQPYHQQPQSYCGLIINDTPIHLGQQN